MYIQVSEQFKENIRSPSRTFEARIKIQDKWINAGFKRIRLEASSTSEDNIQLGAAVSAKIEVTVKNTDQLFENTEIPVEIGLLLPSGEYEYIPAGIFTAEHPEQEGDSIKFTAYDRMIKATKVFISSLTYPTSAADVLEEACSICGVPCDTQGLEDILVQTKPEGYTCREVIGYVANLYGGFACVDREGVLRIKWYEDSGYTVDTSRMFSFTKNESDYHVDYLTCNTDSSTSITSGAGTLGITFSNPFMGQEQLNKIYSEVKGFKYRAAAVSFLGDPRLDVWDIITVCDLNETSYKVPAMNLQQEYDGGLKTTVTAYGKTEAETEIDYKGPSTQKIERIYAELTITNELVAKKVDAEWVKANTVTAEAIRSVEAEISQIKTNYIKSTEADLKYAKIEKVDGIEGRFETFYSHEFTSAVSSIGDLTVSVEKVNTLIFGSASGGSLTTEFSNSVVAMIGDAQIKSAMIQGIDADKIKSGKLYTDFVEVCSQSGNLNIKDNTVQIRDDTGTARVQIGKDSGGDYNIYIWDKDGKLMFDPLYGLCEAGIKQAVIRNDMVSDNADISAEKLNIASLFDVINSDGSHTLTSSKIYVDADNQTLDIAFKNMTTILSETAASVSEAAGTAEAANANAGSALNKVSSVETNLKTISQTVSSQGTQLSTVQGQISNKVWQQDITTAVNEIQIGARNLQKNTEFKVNLANWSVGTGYTRDTAKQFEGANTVKFTRTGLSVNSTSHFFSGSKAIQIEVGQAVTASANFYTDDVSLIDGNKAFIGIFFYNSSGAVIASSQTKISFTDGKWVKCSHTATAPENTVYAAICITTSRNGTYYIGKPMFEKGNKATDWSPAPEDTDSSISYLGGTVTTLNNQYTSLNQSLTSLTATVNSNTTAISKKADGSSVTALDNKITEITASLDGFKSTVSSSYATKTELSAKKDSTYATFYGLGNTAGYCYLCRLKINAASVNTDITIGITQRFKGYSEAYIRFANATGKDPALERFDKTGASIWYIFKAEAGIWDIYVKKSVPYDAIIVDNYLNHVSVSCEWKCVNCDAVSGWSEAKQLAAQYGVDTTTGGINGSGSLITSGAVYNTTVNTNTKIEQTKSSILSTVSSTYATQEQVADVNAKFTDYSTTVQMNSAIEQKAASITQSVSSTYATKSSLGNYATTASVTASLALKIDKTDNNQIVSMINASANEINLKSDRFSLSSSNATISKNGTVMFKAGTIGGWNITASSLYQDYENYRTYIQTAKSVDTWVFSAQEKRDGSYYANWYVTADGRMYANNKVVIDSSGKDTGSYITMETWATSGDKFQTITNGLEYRVHNLTNNNYFVAQSEGIWFGNDAESTIRGSITKDSNNRMSTSFHQYETKNENGVWKGMFSDTELIMFDGWNNVAILADWNGNFKCSGTKNRIVETENFGTVAMNAFETAGAHFADIVSGKIAEDGKCVVYLDRKFAETIDRDCEYQVILTAVGKASELYVIKDKEYFTVCGQAGTNFDCMIIGRQRGYVTSYADGVDFSGLGEEVSESVID